MVNANNDWSKSKSIAKSEADVDFDKEADSFFGALVTDVKQDCFKKRKKSKPVKLPNEIFDFIHIIRCQKLFSLTWNDDLTYVQSEDVSFPKELLVPYCNRPCFNFTKPDYIQRKSFINITTLIIIEVNRK